MFSKFRNHNFFQNYFLISAKSYFENILFFQNMTSPKSKQKNNKKYDFDFCRIIKIKYFLTSFKSEKKIKLFSDFDFFEKYFTLWFRKKPQIMVANKNLKMSKGRYHTRNPGIGASVILGQKIQMRLGTSGSVISGQKIQRELLYPDLGIF